MGRPKTPLAAWIKEQRGSAGWKSEELARRLGVSESTVRGWEAGRTVGADNLEGMERLFDRQAPGHESAGGSDIAAILARMDVQTAAIQRAAEAIERQSEVMSDLLRALAPPQLALSDDEWAQAEAERDEARQRLATPQESPTSGRDE